jgi:hypothetical protein
MTLDRAVLFRGELQNGHVDVPGQEWARERTIIRRDGEEVVIEIFSGGFQAEVPRSARLDLAEFKAAMAIVCGPDE